MASSTLYPCIVNSYEPAFVTNYNNTKCTVYFSLSRFSSYDDINSIHISVYRQDNGISAVNRVSSINKNNFMNSRCRDTGIIILSKKFINVDNEKNLYYVDILNEDIYDGWKAGEVYKIQLRLSSVAYEDSTITQAQWLLNNSSSFSEWSTICITKAIPPIKVTIPLLSFDSDSYNPQKIVTLTQASLDFSGRDAYDLTGKYYCSKDISEFLYSYRYSLYTEKDYDQNIVSDKNLTPVEDSGIIYADKYFHNNELPYTFKTNVQDKTNYVIRISIQTISKYEQTWDIRILVDKSALKEIPLELGSCDSGKIITTLTQKQIESGVVFPDELQSENEESCIKLKLFYADINERDYSGNICVRRASAKNNYQDWEDIKIIVARGVYVKDIPIIYDYTIESGVYYKYAIQEIGKNGERGKLKIMNTGICRVFEDSFLLGKDQKQLKLKFNNDMPSFRRQVSDGKIETINGKYPFIARNGHMDYKIFPINGLIAMEMDEAENFISKQNLKYLKLNKDSDEIKITHFEEVTSFNDGSYERYDLTQQREFRNAVLDFLYDGQAKLFKSPTEGNILVRLTDINCTPIQSLGRLLYSFTATANEIDEPSLKNLQKYNIYTVGNWSKEFIKAETKIGQLYINDARGKNITQLIKSKYDHRDISNVGKRETVGNIYNLVLEFEGEPQVIKLEDNNYSFLGNAFDFNEQRFYVYDTYTKQPGGLDGYKVRRYVFADDINLTLESNISIPNDFEKPVPLMVNFIYELESEPYEAKTVKTRTPRRTFGQYINTLNEEHNIYRDIYQKYYYEWKKYFGRLNSIENIVIEAPVGTQFLIALEGDTEYKNSYYEYTVGYTGILDLTDMGIVKDIRFIKGKTPTSIIIDYDAVIFDGEYEIKKEN